MKRGLFSLQSRHPNSENIERNSIIYKTDNFNNDIVFGVSYLR